MAITAVAALSVFYDWIYAILFEQLLPSNDLYRVRKPVILSVRSLVISSLYYFIIYYLNVVAEKQKAALEIERLKQAQLQAKLLSLKEQLSPHFLFNTLNTLASISSEPDVKKYIYELANVYRYMLQYKDNDIASLQNELSFIHSYLYIIKTRMEDAIQIDIRVDDQVLQSKIPPLTLQILIENAIKHNIAQANDPLEIRIYNESACWVVVQNRLLPKTSVLHTTGIGLDNVIQRYHLLFGKDILIEKNPELFLVKLPVLA